MRIENMLKKIEEAAEVSGRTERVLNLSEADWEVINEDSIEEREVAENMKKELTLSLPGVNYDSPRQQCIQEFFGGEGVSIP